MRILEMVVMKLIHMSIYASFLMATTILLRKIFREIPKKYFYILWLFTFVRLICPWNIQTLFSVLPIQTQAIENESTAVEIPQLQTGIERLDQRFNQSMIQYNAVVSKKAKTETLENRTVLVISLGWLTGFFGITGYVLIRLLRLKRCLKTAILEEDKIYHSDQIQSAFLMGVWSPKIYLPKNLTSRQREHIILHEKVHIKRKDHWIKPWIFFTCMLHWFNPLVWISFSQMSRDIEMAVDEQVCSSMKKAERTEYAKTLFELSMQQHGIMPLAAFGEKPTTERIKKVLAWKKHKKLLGLLAFVLFAFVVLCIGTNKASKKSSLDSNHNPQVTDTISSNQDRQEEENQQGVHNLEELKDMPTPDESATMVNDLELLVQLRTDNRKDTGEIKRVLEIAGFPIQVYHRSSVIDSSKPDCVKLTYKVQKNILNAMTFEQQQEIAEAVFRNCAVLFVTHKGMEGCSIQLDDESIQWTYQYSRDDISLIFLGEETDDLYEYSASAESLQQFMDKLDQYITEKSSDQNLMNQNELTLVPVNEKEQIAIRQAKDVRGTFRTLLTEDAKENLYYFLGESQQFKLYGTADFQTMIIAAGEEYRSVDYPYDSNYMILPDLYESDYDQDGEDELVIILSIIHGTGVNLQTLLLMDQVNGVWKLYQLTPEIYEKNLYTHIDEDNDSDGSMRLRMDGECVGRTLPAEDQNAWIRYSVGEQIAYDMTQDSIVMKVEIAAMQENVPIGQYFGDAMMIEVNYQGAGKWTFGKTQYRNIDLEEAVTYAVNAYYTQDKEQLNSASDTKETLMVCDRHFDTVDIKRLNYDGYKIDGESVEIIATALPEGTDSYDYIMFQMVYVNHVWKIQEMWVEK